jgi:predicted HicB family RNase H-like nuclease
MSGDLTLDVAPKMHDAILAAAKVAGKSPGLR